MEELTAVQRRTFDALIGRARPPEPPAGLAERLRLRMEEGLADLADGLAEPLWLSKAALMARQRCEGLLESMLRGERPFEHRPETAAGTIAHRGVHLDVASERAEDVRTLVERSAPDPDRDAGLAAYWDGLDGLDRAEILQEAARQVALFRDMFPPLERRWQPIPEQGLRVTLADRKVVLSGRVDLMLGRTHRLLLDLKTGEPHPEHAEDMRVYALLCTLFFGVPPFRVATVYLSSLECQPEDVTEELLDHAAGRAVAAARSAIELLGGGEPSLTPGPHCRWCPRALSCPQSLAPGGRGGLAAERPGATSSPVTASNAG